MSIKQENEQLRKALAGNGNQKIVTAEGQKLQAIRKENEQLRKALAGNGSQKIVTAAGQREREQQAQAAERRNREQRAREALLDAATAAGKQARDPISQMKKAEGGAGYQARKSGTLLKQAIAGKAMETEREQKEKQASTARASLLTQILTGQLPETWDQWYENQLARLKADEEAAKKKRDQGYDTALEWEQRQAAYQQARKAREDFEEQNADQYRKGNTALYTIGQAAAGAASGVQNIGAGIETAAINIGTKGKTAEEMPRLNQWLAENPAGQELLQRQEAGEKAMAKASDWVAESAGVDESTVRAWMSATKNQRLTQTIDQTLGKGVSQKYKNTIGSWAYSIGQQVPGILMTAGAEPAAEAGGLLGNLLSGKGAKTAVKAALKGNLATVMIGAASAGGKASQNLLEGEGSLAGYVNALGTGFTEYFTEGLFGFSDMPSYQKIFEDVSGSLTQNLAKAFLNYIVSGGEEGLEEVVNVPLEGIIDKLTIDPGKKLVGDGGIFDFKEMARNGVDGAIVGMLMGGVGAIAGVYDTVRQTRDVNQGVQSLEAIADNLLPENLRPEAPRGKKATIQSVEDYSGQILEAMKQYSEILGMPQYQQAAQAVTDAVTAADQETIRALVDTGLEAEEGTRANQLAQILDRKLEKGYPIKTEEFQKLFRMNAEEQAGINTDRETARAPQTDEREWTGTDQAETQTEDTEQTAAPQTRTEAQEANETAGQTQETPQAGERTEAEQESGERQTAGTAQTAAQQGQAGAITQQEAEELVRLGGELYEREIGSEGRNFAQELLEKKDWSRRDLERAREMIRQEEPTRTAQEAGEGADDNGQQQRTKAEPAGEKRPGPETAGTLPGRAGGRQPSEPRGRRAETIPGETRRRGGTGDNRKAALKRQRATFEERPISPAEYGVPNGTERAGIKEYRKEYWDQEAKDAADWAKKKGVKEVRYFTGLMTVQAGKTASVVNGCLDPETGTLWVKADSLAYSLSELTEHETAHMMALQNPESAEDFRKTVTARHRDWGETFDVYEETYRQVTDDYRGMDQGAKERYVWEEILCDAFAGMDQYGAAASEYGLEADKALLGPDAVVSANSDSGIYWAGSETVEDALARGPPEAKKKAARTDGGTKFSIKRTSQMTLAQQLKMFYDGKMASSDAFYFGETPSALKKSGFDTLPLAMTIGDFRKSTQSKHNIPRRVLKNLMDNLSNPLFSFGNGERVGIVLDDIDGDGYKLLAALEREVNMDREPVNVINSLYGLEHPAEWIKNQIDNENEFVLYDEKRANAFLQTYGYLASVGEGIRSTSESVTKNGAEVKGKFSAAGKNSDSGADADSQARKQKQLEVIQKSNPAEDSYHTWIRSTDDIRTLREALNDPEWAEYDEFDQDYTKAMAEAALKSGKIQIFSSYPIKAGVFVTPSRMEAESYSGNGKIYSRTVNTDDVAWIDPTQGQFAPVKQGEQARYSIKEDSQGRELTEAQREYFKDSKAVDGDGRLLTLYHGTGTNFTIFDKMRIGENFPNRGGDLGFYFSPYIEDARGYAREATFSTGGEKTVMEVYLNLKNPLVIEDDGWGSAISQADIRHGDLKRWAQEGGHDGIIVKSTDEVDDDGTPDAVYIAFSPEQIKNVTNQKPTSNPDIRYSLLNKDLDKAVSKAEEAQEKREAEAPRAEDDTEFRLETPQEQEKLPNRKDIQDRVRVVKSEAHRKLQELFPMPAGKKSEARAETETLLRQLSWRQVDKKQMGKVFDLLYESARVPDYDNYDAVYKDAAEMLKKSRIYQGDLKAEFGDDYKHVRARLMGAGIYLTNDRSDPGLDRIYKDMSASFPGIFDERETDPRVMAETLLRVTKNREPKMLTLDEEARKYGGEEAQEKFREYYREKYLEELREAYRGFAGAKRSRKDARDRNQERKLQDLSRYVEQARSYMQKKAAETLEPLPASMAERIRGMSERTMEDARKAEEERKRLLLETIPKEQFKGTDSLRKLGVRIEGSVASYQYARSLVENQKAAWQMNREIERAEMALSPNRQEERLADMIYNGEIQEQDLNRFNGITDTDPITGRKTQVRIRKDVVMQLADYKMVRNMAADSLLQTKRRQIKRVNEYKADKLVEKMDMHPAKETAVSKIIMNVRTPERVVRNLFGQKDGAEIYDTVFRPVGVNEAERLRFVNKQLDDMREFADENGEMGTLSKTERAIAQSLLEGRALPGILRDMGYRGKLIQDAADNLRLGSTVDDEMKEFGLGAEEGKLASDYANYLEALEEAETDPNVSQARVENAAEAFQKRYDEYYDAINDFLVSHGYAPIGYIKSYAPHMQREEATTKFQGILQQLGLSAEQVKGLPTAIAGRTADFKPNKRWVPYFQSRKGEDTLLDVYRGFENYTKYVSDVFYHTDDIMRLRELGNGIRRKYAGDEVKNRIDWAEALRAAGPERMADALKTAGVIPRGDQLTPESTRARLEDYISELYDTQANPTQFGEFTTWVENYANILAGKQSMADRGLEYVAGRGALNFARKAIQTFARTQVAGNLSSAINQTAQIPQIAAELGGEYVARAIKDMASGAVQRDSFLERSDFLAGKKGIESLLPYDDAVTTKLGKAAAAVTNFGFKPLEAVDTFTATVAVRAAYLKALADGAAPDAAMKQADDFARQVMGSRVKGEKPQMFESKNPFIQMLGLFQVEASTAFDHMVSDIPQQMKARIEKDGKAAASRWLAQIITKTLLYGFLLNRITEEVTGGTPAQFDVLGWILDAAAGGKGTTGNQLIKTVVGNGLYKLTGEKIGTDETLEEGFDWGEAVGNLSKSAAGDVPYLRNAASIVGWGDETLPLSDVAKILKNIKDIGVMAADAAKGEGELSGWRAADDLITAGSEFLPAGRQLSKTYQGVKTMIQGGKYKGYGEKAKLAYPVDRIAWNAARTALFGTNSLSEQRGFYADGANYLSPKQSRLFKEMTESGADPEETYRVIQEYRKLEKNEDLDKLEKQAKQRGLITRADMTDGQKLTLYTGLENAEKRAEKFQNMMDAGLNWDDIMEAYTAYSEINSNEDLTAGQKASRFAAALDQMGLPKAKKDAAKEQLMYYATIPAESKNYNKMKDEGVSVETALKIQDNVSALKPEEGNKAVTDAQKVRAIAEGPGSQTEKVQALGAYLSEERVKKIRAALDAGIDMKTYADFWAATSKMENDWKEDEEEDEEDDPFAFLTSGQKTQHEGQSRKEKILEYIDQMDLTTEQKDVLFLDYYAKSGLDDTPWNNWRWGW